MPAPKNLRKPPIKSFLTCRNNICRSWPCLPKRTRSLGHGDRQKHHFASSKAWRRLCVFYFGEQMSHKTNVMPDTWSTIQSSPCPSHNMGWEIISFHYLGTRENWDKATHKTRWFWLFPWWKRLALLHKKWIQKDMKPPESFLSPIRAKHRAQVEVHGSELCHSPGVPGEAPDCRSSTGPGCLGASTR